MKSVQIDFVERRAWRFVWAVAAAVVLAIISLTAVKVWQLRLERAALERELADLQARQQRLAQSKVPEPVQNKPRSSSEAAAMHLLQRDWNHLYDAIETQALAKVRLVQLSVDAVTGQVMLEYELETMAQAADVTQALNDASGESGTWQLELLVNGTPTGAVTNTSRIKGVWRSKVK